MDSEQTKNEKSTKCQERRIEIYYDAVAEKWKVAAYALPAPELKQRSKR